MSIHDYHPIGQQSGPNWIIILIGLAVIAAIILGAIYGS
jgi:hypothetical protein